MLLKLCRNPLNQLYNKNKIIKQVKYNLLDYVTPMQQYITHQDDILSSNILQLPKEAYLYNCFIQKRTYIHFRPIRPEDWELPEETMPENISDVLKKDPRQLDFFENYWYWRIRSEATMLNPENLPKKSYRQLAQDMGMQIISEKNEHLVGLIELYEYLILAPCVGPFGTLENPVLIPSVSNERIVVCSGGTGDNEHHLLYFRCREGFLYRCGECDQVFMLVRVLYSLPEGIDPFPVDHDINDVFDLRLLEKGQKMWNTGEYVYWPAGNLAYKRAFMDGEFGNDIPVLDGQIPLKLEDATQIKKLKE